MSLGAERVSEGGEHHSCNELFMGVETRNAFNWSKVERILSIRAVWKREMVRS